MSDFNIQFEEQDQSITLEFEQIGGGAVKSVNGKVGEVVLGASDVGALPSSTSIPAVDNTLTVAGAAADAKKTGDELSSLKEEISQLSGLSEEVKVALLQITQKVAYVDEHGQDYYDDLYNALYPPADLVSISAVYTQSGTVYDTDTLDSLKADLVVTAHMSDQTTRTVTEYTLSGTLTEGTSTVTVAYGGKTTTFSVTVTAKGKSDMDGWTDGVSYTDLTIVQNEYCQAITGNFMSYNGWDRTGYVPCNGASTITFPPMPQSDGAPDSNRFFKEDKTVYGSRSDKIELSKTESTTITVPSEAYYFVISSESAALASCIGGGIVPNA